MSEQEMSVWSDIPQPKYRVGQTIYRPSCEHAIEEQTCPDCFGTKKWTVTTPAGTSFETACQRCGTYNASLKRIAVFKPVVSPMTIQSVEVKSNRTFPEDDLIRYYSNPTCTGYVVQERDVITNEETALVIAQTMAEEKTREMHAQSAKEIERARELNSLTIIDAKIREAERKAWDARYELDNLKAEISDLDAYRPGEISAEQARAVIAHLGLLEAEDAA